MRADEVYERCLTRTVRSDERQELALLHDEIHAVAGEGFAELFAQINGLQQDSHDFTFSSDLVASRDSAPTMPVGRTMTSRTSTVPSKACQYSVVATA